MDVRSGNMPPNYEAEDLRRQATMRTDAWSRDEEHEPSPHRQGEEAEAEAERVLRRRKQWVRKRSVKILDQSLDFCSRASRSRIRLHVRNGPPSHGFDLAATRTRACELVAKLHWRTFPKRPAKSQVGLALIAQSVFGMFGLLFTVAFNEMVIKWSVTAANADGILTDPVTVEVHWHAVQEGLRDQMTFFCILVLAIILEPTRWLTR